MVHRREPTWFDLPQAHRITVRLVQSALRLESNKVPTLAVQRTRWSSQWRNLPPDKKQTAASTGGTFLVCASFLGSRVVSPFLLGRASHEHSLIIQIASFKGG